MKFFANTTERLVGGLISTLPVPETGRNEWGVLWFKWPALYPEIEALWLSVTPHEVVLSCKLAHLHFGKTRYRAEKLTNLKIKKRIAHDAVKEAGRFLRGEIAVVTELSEQGTIGPSIWCRKARLHEALAHSRNVLGNYKNFRAWTWSGAFAP